MKGGGLAVTVTNPCLPHPAFSQGSPCFWGCWAEALTSWGQAASLRCPEPQRCCPSSRSARWVSPHAPRTRMGLSLDLDTTQVHQWQMGLIVYNINSSFENRIHFWENVGKNWKSLSMLETTTEMLWWLCSKHYSQKSVTTIYIYKATIFFSL